MDDITRRLHHVHIRNSTLPSRSIQHDLRIYPLLEELNGITQIVVKPNKVDGPYSSVSDYIDIHFKLLRADFILPITDDMINSFQNRKKYDNIVIHENVKFDHADIYKQHDAYKLKLSKKKLHNDLDGSLLILTRDDFNSVIFGKLTGSNTIYFEYKVSISLNSSYKLVECNTFFEPYYNSLKFLKELNLSNFPMKRYIINVEREGRRPSYMPAGIESSLLYERRLFNEPQFSAFKGALLNEFALIQGPPGTGKTYLGVGIVRKLLEYKNYWHPYGPLLVVCYTNHALDQFLEKLLEVTHELVRFGGGSESDSLENYMIKNVRREVQTVGPRNNFREMYALRDNMDTLKDKMKLFDTDVLYAVNFFGTLTMDQFIVWLLYENNDPEINEFNGILSSYGSNKSAGVLQEMNAIEKTIEQKILKLNRNNLISVTVNTLKRHLRIIQNKKRILQSLISKRENYGMRRYNDNELKYLSPTQKWQHVNQITEVCRTHLIQKLSETAKAYRKQYKINENDLEAKDIQLMRSKLIVGMTTTAASRMNSALEKVGCPIVIVEEAAEVLEAHTVSSLTKNCQHLILIGDHKQLQPKTADQNLGKNYRLSTSLFERMVVNKIPFYTLTEQHRMRPEISCLITPSIYPKLSDAENVKKYKGVRGLAQPVYFINHYEREEKNEKQSRSNVYEAKFLLKVVNHLILNGYKSDEITVIAAYAFQVETLNKELKKYSSQTHNVHISTIDGYQGEQNKIILLSLVCNNSKGNIGFLNTPNRVCVALSRAQEGLIIMGNMDSLSRKSGLWRQIKAKLCVGDSLPLKCETHSRVQLIETISDFDKSPLGGCLQNCGHIYECRHTCPSKCHFLIDGHDKYCDTCLKIREAKKKTEMKSNSSIRSNQYSRNGSVTSVSSSHYVNHNTQPCGQFYTCGHKCQAISCPLRLQYHGNYCAHCSRARSSYGSNYPHSGSSSYSVSRREIPESTYRYGTSNPQVKSLGNSKREEGRKKLIEAHSTAFFMKNNPLNLP